MKNEKLLNEIEKVLKDTNQVAYVESSGHFTIGISGCQPSYTQAIGIV